MTNTLFLRVVVLVSTLISSFAIEQVMISGLPFNSKLNNPWGIWRDINTGYLYISEPLSHRVLVTDPSNSISIFAGTGDEGFLGDNDFATTAKLSTPKGIWGNSELLYICDTSNNRLRAVNLQTNIITTVAGGGLALPTATSQTLRAKDAFLILPRAVWGNGADLYLSDMSKVYLISSNGLIRLFAGGGVELGYGPVPATRLSLNNPTFLAGDAMGNIYLSDSGNNVIRKINSNGDATVFAGYLKKTDLKFLDGKRASQIRLESPAGLWVDNQQSLVFADSGLSVIGKIDLKDETVQRLAGTFGWSGGIGRDDTGDNFGDGTFGSLATFNNPVGLWGDDSTGSIFIADLLHSSVRVAQYLATPSPSAAPTIVPPSGPNIYGFQYNTLMRQPYAVWEAPDGRLFLSDPLWHVIYRILPGSNNVEVLAGIRGIPGLQDGRGPEAQFDGPRGIWGNSQLLYVCDNNNNLVRSVDTFSGDVTTFIGGGSANPITAAPNSVSPRGALLNGALAIWSTNDGGRLFFSTNDAILSMTPTSINLYALAQSVQYLTGDMTGSNIYYSDPEMRVIHKVPAVGNPSVFAGGHAITDYFPDGTDRNDIVLRQPTGLWIDPTDTYLYFADEGTQIVGRIELQSSGTASRYAGTFYQDGGAGKDLGDGRFGDGDLAVNAQLNRPGHLWGNRAGDLFIVDYGHASLREVSSTPPQGYVPMLFGAAPFAASKGQLRGSA